MQEGLFMVDRLVKDQASACDGAEGYKRGRSYRNNVQRSIIFIRWIKLFTTENFVVKQSNAS